MFRILSAVALLLPLFPTLITAQCAACDSYTAALQSCQTTSANVTAVGTTMDSTTLHCMCTSNSDVTEMNACRGCEDSNPSTTLDVTVLAAWTLTCTAEGQFGDQQAEACWNSQPDNVGPCVSKSSAGESASAGGDTIFSTSSQSATTSPTATSKSDAMLSLQAPVLLSVLVVGLGMAIEL